MQKSMVSAALPAQSELRTSACSARSLYGEAGEPQPGTHCTAADCKAGAGRGRLRCWRCPGGLHINAEALEQMHWNAHTLHCRLNTGRATKAKECGYNGWLGGAKDPPNT